MDVAEFVAKNYYNDETLDRINEERALLNHPGVYFKRSPDAELVLIYMALSDNMLAKLRSISDANMFTPAFTSELLSNSGRNIYVFRLVTEGPYRIQTLREMRDSIIKEHNAKTFSWHDDKNVLLHTYEVK